MLAGPSVASVLPAVSPAELARFVRAELDGYWLGLTRRPWLWVRDFWVDLSLLAVCRSMATLEDGRLITKAEAIARLGDLGLPAWVVDDVRARRDGEPLPLSYRDRVARGWVARAWVRSAVRGPSG